MSVLAPRATPTCSCSRPAASSQAAAPLARARRSLVVQASAGKPAAGGDVTAPQLTRPKPASSAQQAQAAAPPPSTVNPAAIAEAYTRAADAKARGDAVDVRVVGQNEGGVVVQLGVLRGFIPYNKLDPARLRSATNGDLSSLLGLQLRARVVLADPSRRELILSERAVAAAAALERLSPGDVVEGVVSSVEDYGAFITLKDAPEVSGLVHKSEVSWERLLTVDSALRIGQAVSAKVLAVNPAAGRLTLSLKALAADPLRTSLDSLGWEDVAPAAEAEEGVAGGGAVAGDPKIQALVAALASAIGVEGVTVTRTAQDPHHVAQELELYLVRSETEGEYTAVARYGVSATQLRLSAPGLSREALKLFLQRVAAGVGRAGGAE